MFFSSKIKLFKKARYKWYVQTVRWYVSGRHLRNTSGMGTYYFRVPLWDR